MYLSIRGNAGKVYLSKITIHLSMIPTEICYATVYNYSNILPTVAVDTVS